MKKPDGSSTEVFLINMAHGPCDISVLHADEQARMERLKSADLGWQFAIGRWFLRLVLAWKSGIPARELQITANELGKPKLPKHLGLEFNLSHSGSFVLLATNDLEPIGVDIQKMTLNVPLGVEETVFTPRERRDIRLAESHPIAFYTAWARKEAVLKCKGTGFVCDPQSVEVSIDPKRQFTKACSVSQSGARRATDEEWIVVQPPVISGYALAIASRSVSGSIHYWYGSIGDYVGWGEGAIISELKASISG